MKRRYLAIVLAVSLAVSPIASEAAPQTVLASEATVEQTEDTETSAEQMESTEEPADTVMEESEVTETTETTESTEELTKVEEGTEELEEVVESTETAEETEVSEETEELEETEVLEETETPEETEVPEETELSETTETLSTEGEMQEKITGHRIAVEENVELDPTDEQLEQWQKDGTLQQRVNFMKGLNQNTNTKNLIGQRLREESGVETFANVPANWTGGIPSEGNVKALVFMVDFADMRNTNPELTPENVQATLFGPEDTTGYQGFPYESLSAYYARSSYGKLNITGDVYGWYNLSGNRSDYEDDYLGRDKMIQELLTAYDDQINYDDYDADGDGRVDALYIHFAGPHTDWGTQWWSYMTHTGTEIQYDQTEIYTYMFLHSLEPYVAIHESGHALGLPDYYSYETLFDEPGENAERGGAGYCDMMDHNIGDHNLFSKMLLGWVDPIFIHGTGESELKLISSEEARPVIVTNTENESIFDEYYLLDLYDNSGNNAASTKTDKPKVRIYHVNAKVDENGYDFLSNNSDTEYKLLKLMQSDGTEGNGLYAHPITSQSFYGEGMEFGPNTLPGSEYYGGIYTGLSIRVESVSGDSARISVETVSDTQAPDVQIDALKLGSATFQAVPQMASMFNIYFDSYIYKGENFPDIFVEEVLTGNRIEAVYDILNPRPKYPNSTGRYHILQLQLKKALESGKEYKIIIPAGSVCDAAGNVNEQIELPFSCMKEDRACKLEKENFLGNSDENAYVQVFPMSDGKLLVVTRQSENWESTSVVMYSADGIKLSEHTIPQSGNLSAAGFAPVGKNAYVLIGGGAMVDDYGYLFINADGTILESGRYSNLGENYKYDGEFVQRDDCVDVLLRYYDNTSQWVRKVCRFNEAGSVEILPVKLPGDGTASLKDYDKEYQTKPKHDVSIGQRERFDEQNYENDYLYKKPDVTLVQEDAEQKAYLSYYFVTSNLDFTEMGNSSSSVEICDEKDNKKVECRVIQGENMNGLGRMIFLGEGKGYLLERTVNEKTEDGWYNETGTQYIYMDEDLNAYWTAVDESEPGVWRTEPFCWNGKICFLKGNDLYSMDNSDAEIWISSQKGFSVNTSIGTVDEEKQTIQIEKGTTLQNIADSIEGKYSKIEFYNADYAKMGNWNESVDEGLMCVTTQNGFYDYYYQISTMKKLSFDKSAVFMKKGDTLRLDCVVEPAGISEENIRFTCSDANVVDVGWGLESGEYGLYLTADTDGTAELKIYNVFGNLEGKCVVTVGNAGAVTVTGTISSFGDASDKITVQLADVAGDIAAETTVTGNQTEYILEGIGQGDYILKVSKENHVTREYPITITSDAANQNAEIHLIGDVDGDGRLNARDKKMLYNHIAGNALLTGYDVTVGDVDDDGKINAKDKKMIYNHIAGNALLWK